MQKRFGMRRIPNLPCFHQVNAAFFPEPLCVGREPAGRIAAALFCCSSSGAVPVACGSYAPGRPALRVYQLPRVHPGQRHLSGLPRRAIQRLARRQRSGLVSADGRLFHHPAYLGGRSERVAYLARRTDLPRHGRCEQQLRRLWHRCRQHRDLHYHRYGQSPDQQYGICLQRRPLLAGLLLPDRQLDHALWRRDRPGDQCPAGAQLRPQRLQRAGPSRRRHLDPHHQRHLRSGRGLPRRLGIAVCLQRCLLLRCRRWHPQRS